jgi:hypothetical protein
VSSEFLGRLGGSSDVIACGTSGDFRQPPPQPINRVLLDMKFAAIPFSQTQLLELENHPPELLQKPVELASLSGARLKCADVAGSGHGSLFRDAVLAGRAEAEVRLGAFA